MKRKLTTAPTTWPVITAEAKTRLVIEFSDDDALLSDLIAEATDWAEAYMGRSIMPQTWTYYFDSFPADIIIDSLSVTGVAIKYDDSSNNPQTLASSNYNADLISYPIKISTIDGWPSTYNKPNSVRVEVSEGSVTVPGSIKAGVLLLVGHLYNNREGTSDRKVNEVPLGVESFLSKYRVIK